MFIGFLNRKTAQVQIFIGTTLDILRVKGSSEL